VVFELRKSIYFSTYPPTYTCTVALPVRRNPQHRRLLIVVPAPSALPFQPLRQQRNVCHPVVTCFTLRTLPTVNRKHFFMNILCIVSFCPQETHNRTLLFSSTSSSRSPFWLLKPTSYHAHALPGLSWSWTVLLPSDTHRTPITSITAVLLPFVTCLHIHSSGTQVWRHEGYILTSILNDRKD
jgi:hypothetical protein